MTRGLRLAVLYLALGMGANAAAAEGHEDLLQGDMAIGVSSTKLGSRYVA